MMKLASLVAFLSAVGCGSSTAPPGPVADAEPTATSTPAETSVATAGEPSAAPPADSGPPASHAGGPPACEELAKACHDVGHGPGEAGKCHEIGHKGDAQVCEKDRDRCLKLCADAAKSGAHQHKH